MNKRTVSQAERRTIRMDTGEYSDNGAQYTEISHALRVDNGATREIR